MPQALRTIFQTNEQARVRKAMSHRPVFKAAEMLPDDIAEKLLRLDLAFREKAATAQD